MSEAKEKVTPKPETEMVGKTVVPCLPVPVTSDTIAVRICELSVNDDIADYRRLTEHIEKLMLDIKNKQIAVCLDLHMVSTRKLYKIDGYKDIYAYADEKFKIQRGTCSNYINICKRFGQFSDDGSCYSLLPQYTGFSISQLQAMLYINDEGLAKCCPKLTVKKLKVMQKKYPRKKTAKPVIETEQVASEDDKLIFKPLPMEDKTEKKKKPSPKKKKASTAFKNSEFSSAHGKRLLTEVNSLENITDDIKRIDKELIDFKGIKPNVTPKIQLLLVW